MMEWSDVETIWSHLRGLFDAGGDLASDLPETMELFVETRSLWMELMTDPELSTVDLVTLCLKKGMYIYIYLSPLRFFLFVFLALYLSLSSLSHLLCHLPSSSLSLFLAFPLPPFPSFSLFLSPYLISPPPSPPPPTDTEAKLVIIRNNFHKCSVSLDHYLELKRNQFARLNFLSRSDLIGLLSNRSSTASLSTYLSKMFDGVKEFVFDTQETDQEEEEEGEGEGRERERETERERENSVTHRIVAVVSIDNEVMRLIRPVLCESSVTGWLEDLLEVISTTLELLISHGLISYRSLERCDWVCQELTQVSLLGVQVYWNADVLHAFSLFQSGNDSALKDFARKQQKDLDSLTRLVRSQSILPTSMKGRGTTKEQGGKERVSEEKDKEEREMTSSNRQLLLRKLSAVITTDVHSRDVVTKLIEDKVTSSGDFEWQKQLRLMCVHVDGEEEETGRESERERERERERVKQDGRMNSSLSLSPSAHFVLPGSDYTSIHVQCCDATFTYLYEFIGHAASRLVITPLTDRCYVTLTQALKLHLGGNPMGPAGTGKTETTKDLGRVMGRMVFVFNCSEQMDTLSLSHLLKGLCTSGTWGCFDEFNRINVSVLAVLSTQISAILTGLRSRSLSIHLNGESVPLVSSVGIFVTMNPGYAGRAELPQSLKSLFRPVTMMRPDSVFICENLLLAHGFLSARELSKKCLCVVKFCSDVLSQQSHYDWGLRTLKSIVLAAGARMADSLRDASSSLSLTPPSSSSQSHSPLSHLSPSSSSRLGVGVGVSSSGLPSSPGLSPQESKKKEERIMYGVLRDFTVPKLIKSDRKPFMGILRDTFPSIEPASTSHSLPFASSVSTPMAKNDTSSLPSPSPAQHTPTQYLTEREIQETAEKMGLQPERQLIQKVKYLYDLFQFRQSLFLIGPSRTGKSTAWRVLSRCLSLPSRHIQVVNPKARSSNELFGYYSPRTKEWVDGEISSHMRTFVELTESKEQRDDGEKISDGGEEKERKRDSKADMSASLSPSSSHLIGSDWMWVILDGAVESDWIESLNTVMDDNRVLTLANNERIPFLPNMRLIFECSDLSNATPATVSRAGALFFAPNDIGWESPALSWSSSLSLSHLSNQMSRCILKYTRKCVDFLSSLETVEGWNAFSAVSLLTASLSSLMDEFPFNFKTDTDPEVLEKYFIFSSIWAFGMYSLFVCFSLSLLLFFVSLSLCLFISPSLSLPLFLSLSLSL